MKVFSFAEKGHKCNPNGRPEHATMKHRVFLDFWHILVPLNQTLTDRDLKQIAKVSSFSYERIQKGIGLFYVCKIINFLIFYETPRTVVTRVFGCYKPRQITNLGLANNFHNALSLSSFLRIWQSRRLFPSNSHRSLLVAYSLRYPAIEGYFAKHHDRGYLD